MKQLIELYQPATLVGHSLSAYMIDVYKQSNPNINIRGYGAPKITSPFRTSQTRKSHWGDPVSILDFSSKHNMSPSFNPHSYRGF